MKIKTETIRKPRTKKNALAFSETNKMITELLMKGASMANKPEGEREPKLEIEPETTSQNSQKEAEALYRQYFMQKEEAKNARKNEIKTETKNEIKTEIKNEIIDIDEKNSYEYGNEEIDDDNDEFCEMKKNNFAGISEKGYFIEKQNIEGDNVCSFDKKDFYMSNVKYDANSGYRALSLQIFGNEENHREIRKAIYTCLLNNKQSISRYYFERDGKIISGDNYLKYVKVENEPIGDLEISALSFLFNAEMYLFELRDDGKIYLLNEVDKIEDKDEDKIFLNLCLVKGSHFQVIYEGNRQKNFFCNKEELVGTIERNIKKQESLKMKFEYTKDKRKARYTDIANYLASKVVKNEVNYPDFIYNIEDEHRKRNTKKLFRDLAKKYFIDEKTGRLKLSFNISNKAGNKDLKEFFVVYQFEKINIIKKIHESIAHRGENGKGLDEAVKECDFWWYGIYQDIKKYANYCPICH